MGLASVYGIVKQSGGHVWVYSEIGRGTTFKVYLPRTHETADVRAPVPVDAATLRGNETILVVEDEKMVRAIVDRVLSGYGYTVHAVSDPLQAIELTSAQDLQIEIILTDIVLPGMSGRAMVQELQQRHPNAKVLYMSG